MHPIAFAPLLLAVRSEWSFMAFVLVMALWLWISKPWKK